jgi:hypothetical protein
LREQQSEKASTFRLPGGKELSNEERQKNALALQKQFEEEQRAKL